MCLIELFGGLLNNNEASLTYFTKLFKFIVGYESWMIELVHITKGMNAILNLELWIRG